MTSDDTRRALLALSQAIAARTPSSEQYFERQCPPERKRVEPTGGGCSHVELERKTMPNHCHNDLYVDGPKEDVDALLRLVGADKEAPEFNCGAVIPYPEHWAKLDKDRRELGWKGFEDRYGKGAKDGFNSGGYEWRCENWGTKWGAYDVKRRDYGGVCVTFQSAWSAPAPVIEALHRLFPKCSLHLEWFERGMGTCGGFSCVSEDDWWDDDEAWAPGKRTSEWHGEYRGTRGG